MRDDDQQTTVTVADILAAPMVLAVEGYDKADVIRLTLLGIKDGPEFWSAMDQVGASSAFSVICKGRRTYDSRRSASLYVIGFEGEPVAVAALAGREEDDTTDVRVVSVEGAKKLAAAVAALAAAADIEPVAAALTEDVPLPKWGREPARLGVGEYEGPL